MIKNYLKIVIRNIIRQKGYTFLNLAGLTIGIIVTTLIMLYVKFEWEYDKFYPNADNIYHVIQRQPGNIFMGTDFFAVTPEPLGQTIHSEFPEVENYVTFSSWKETIVEVNGNKHFEENVLYATAPNLFDIFSFELSKGDSKTALSQLNSVVISENAAIKFFENENPIGKTITVKGSYVWAVTGIFKSMPSNSQFSDFGMITSFDTYASILHDGDAFNWSNSSYQTFIVLKKDADPKFVEAKFSVLVNKYMTYPDGEKELKEYILQPLKDIHLYNKANFPFNKTGDIKVVLILTAIALIILLIACINYTNLSTARASLRAKEVGVRKVIGAKKGQLIYQFIGEAVVLSVTAGIIALIFVSLLLPSFFQMIGINPKVSSLLQPSFLIGFMFFTVAVGLMSGAYPAFIISGYQPIRVLKGNNKKGSERTSLRRVLVLIQFTASISLITCTYVILKQMYYIKSKDMGYNRDNIIVLKLNDESVLKQLKSMKHDLEQNPAVVGITASSSLPVDIDSKASAKKDGDAGNNSVQAYQLSVDYDFISTFNINIVEGRRFSQFVSTDSINGVLINQSLEKVLGIEPAIGKTINLGGGDNEYNVIGVMKDFNMHSVHHKIQPLYVTMDDPYYQYLCIRIRPQNISKTVGFINSVWNKYAKLRPFDYSFLDTEFNLLYGDEEKLAQVVVYSSGLAIFVACLGLLGLVSFIVEQRKKEIGIRKVLGASINSILLLLSKRIITWVLIANVIAIPFAYYLMNKWLEDFAYRIDISWWMFSLAGGIALLIALATVSFHAIKAALANPVESLRCE